MPVKRQVPDAMVAPRTSGRLRRPAAHLAMEAPPDALRTPRVSASAGLPQPSTGREMRARKGKSGDKSSNPQPVAASQVKVAPATHSRSRSRSQRPQPFLDGNREDGDVLTSVPPRHARRSAPAQESDLVHTKSSAKRAATPQARSSRGAAAVKVQPSPAQMPRASPPDQGRISAQSPARGKGQQLVSHARGPDGGVLRSARRGARANTSSGRKGGPSLVPIAHPVVPSQGTSEQASAVVGPVSHSQGADIVSWQDPRSAFTSAAIDSELAVPNADIGNGARTAVLWSEKPFDFAVIGLSPGGHISETNATKQDMIFVVIQGEVEYELHGERSARALRLSSEAIAPSGSTYTWRNCSDTTDARISCVVPRVDD